VYRTAKDTFEKYAYSSRIHFSTLGFSVDSHKIFTSFVLKCTYHFYSFFFYHSLWLHRYNMCIVPLQRMSVIIRTVVVCYLFSLGKVP